jgi:predicted HTH transcriptional regulator
MLDVDAIIHSGEFDQLLGHPEGQEMECKLVPHALDSPSGRYELAKDVSAFANGTGGYLLIGIKTERSTQQQLDVLHSLPLISREQFEIARAIGVIKDHIYPEISGLDVFFAPAKGASDKGLGVIRVPRQHADRGPFLISRVVEDSQYLRHIVAGYVERVGDSAEPLSPKLLQQRFQKGSDTVALRLARIEERLDSIMPATGQVQQPVIDRSLRDRRISDVMEER